MKHRSDYTPEAIACTLLASCNVSKPRRIVDFCAGNGSLLRAAQAIWSNSSLFGVDIDPSVNKAVPSAEWLCGDFLNPSFTEAHATYPYNSFDLILLNPPFSFEREKLHSPRGVYAGVKASLSFSFLLTAVQYLEASGELLAIMPTSTLESERDKYSRSLLGGKFSTQIICPPSYDRFPDLDVSTYLLSVRHKNPEETKVQLLGDGKRIFEEFKVCRGNVSVRRKERVIQSGLHSWIHTTSISGGRVRERYELPEQFYRCRRNTVPKGTLIIPRVGRVLPDDVIVTRRREILSDCLVGVVFQDVRKADWLLERIKLDFDRVLELYSGTGAPYLTTEKVRKFIGSMLLGFAAPENRSVAETNSKSKST